MQSHYKTEQGKEVKVLQFDGTNRMAYCDFGEGELRWAGEPEYKTWEPLYEYVPDIPAQAEEKVTDYVEKVVLQTEQPAEVTTEGKPKRTRKKKENATDTE